MADEYRNIDDAAAAALFRLLTVRRPGAEAIGAIVPRAEGFGFTEPQNTANAQGSHAEAYVPAGLAALFHNHPLHAARHRPSGSDRDQSRFSANDVAIANQLDVPSYIAVDKGDPITAEIFKYTPGSAATGAGRHGVRGEPVLAEIPIDMMVDYVNRRGFLRNQASGGMRGRASAADFLNEPSERRGLLSQQDQER